ncbi:MAG: serine--tRNA ligase [Candidatus Nucleicultricaceae bacterium]
MIDIKWIRENPELLDKNLARRGQDPKASHILDLDKKHRDILTEIQDYQNKRNSIAREIGALKQQGKDASDLLQQSAHIKERLPVLEAERDALEPELHLILTHLPNILDDAVPTGADETFNQEVSRWGTPPSFAFTPKHHYELGEALGLMDFSAATRMSGARFVALKGALAFLERALGNFMVDIHTRQFGYTEVSPPYLVLDKALFGTGQLPKFGEDLFKTTENHWLIPTAEVSLTNLVREEILDERQLPTRFTAYTPCFRSEAGSAGRDTRGMIRQHQFHKVELVSIVHPEQSAAEHERMRGAAEEILQQLGLPYRVMMLSSGDTGATSKKTYDLEVWLPGEAAYREISSCSNCGDYQARRMNTRFRTPDTTEKKGGLQFVHTLNGSGLAVGRTLIALLENYQQEDGSIIIPSVLRPYMNGLEKITA